MSIFSLFTTTAKYSIEEFRNSAGVIHYSVYRKVAWYEFKEPLCYIDYAKTPYFKFLERGNRSHVFDSLSEAKVGIQRSIWQSAYEIHCRALYDRKKLISTGVVHSVPPW